MRKTTLAALSLMIISGVAKADVTVNFKVLPEDSKVVAVSLPIADMNKSRAERRAATTFDTLTVVNNRVTMPLDKGPAQYSIGQGDNLLVRFFAAPGENIVIDINSIDPMEYTMTGTELVDGIQAINNASAPIVKQITDLRKQETSDNAALEALFADYQKVFTDFIAANPQSPAVPYALITVGGEELVNGFDAMTPEAKKSIVMPIAQSEYERTLSRLEQEKKQQALQSGDIEAPAFTLKNPEGKDVSLSDFRGKWVIIDFWGTWCPWCIKGFPALKEAYKKYAGKLEVIGVDCNDSEEQWRNGIVKYELPWVQVYKPESDRKILEDYYVQGFPTKVVVNPEGKIANITVGEDPDFFNILASLIGE